MTTILSANVRSAVRYGGLLLSLVEDSAMVAGNVQMAAGLRRKLKLDIPAESLREK